MEKNELIFFLDLCTNQILLLYGNLEMITTVDKYLTFLLKHLLFCMVLFFIYIFFVLFIETQYFFL